MEALTFDRVVAGGDGLARTDRGVCLVPYALPGDSAVLKNVRKRKGVLRGEIDTLVEPSASRVDVICPVFGRCGGCTWLHFSYPDQAEWKRRIVQECFQRIAKIDVDVAWRDDPELRGGYRTRATFRQDERACGFFERGTHTLVDVIECPLCHPRLNEALGKLREIGAVGSFEITVNPEGEEVLVWTADASPTLRDAFPELDAHGGAEPRHGFSFDGAPIVNGAFSQSSLLLNRVLRRQVHEAMDGVESLLDLFCGNGNLSLTLPESLQVLGLDHDVAAVEAASAHATPTKTYQAASAATFTKAITGATFDAIVLDPPRQGARDLMSVLAQARAKRLIYVSCDPATLARDSRILLEKGRKLAQLTAIDLFPHTSHIECVAVFE